LVLEKLSNALSCFRDGQMKIENLQEKYLYQDFVFSL